MMDDSSQRRHNHIPELDNSSRRRLHVHDGDDHAANTNYPGKPSLATRHPSQQQQQQLQPPPPPHSSSRQSPPPPQYRTILTFLLFLGNVMSWYFTNGMNGIQMQHFAQTVHKDMDHQTATTVDMIFVSLAITSLQLLAGGLLGMLVIASWTLIVSIMSNTQHPHDKTDDEETQPLHPHASSSPSKDVATKQQTTTNTSSASSLWRRLVLQLQPQPASKLQLASLHAMGSAATNLGFLYGSASLVQIVKLLEPFETLLLSLLVLPATTKCQGGLVASMMVTVGAAISLVQSRSKPAPWPSVLFAILSGMTLSLRNVLQRRSLTTVGTATSTTTTNATTTSTTTTTNDDDGSPSKTTKPASMASSASTTAAATSSSSAKLAKSILSFTQLSTHAGGIILVAALSLASFVSTDSRHLLTWNHYASWGLLGYHPLYNIFSMVTLGFCTALTHSLLNAGKRVYAIIIAIVWFNEGFSFATVVGLVVVAMGGCWYTLESKQSGKPTNASSSSSSFVSKGWSKPAAAVVLLVTMYQLQQVSFDVDRSLIDSMFGTAPEAESPP